MILWSISLDHGGFVMNASPIHDSWCVASPVLIVGICGSMSDALLQTLPYPFRTLISAPLPAHGSS